jgi:hypothetical protein
MKVKRVAGVYTTAVARNWIRLPVFVGWTFLKLDELTLLGKQVLWGLG